MLTNFRKPVAIILTVMMTAFFIPTISYAASKADEIEYSTDVEEDFEFDEDDFNKVCKELTSSELDYVNIDPPSSSKGKLYYDYDGDDEEKVDDSDEYYYDKNPSIDDISFVPDDDYEGTVTISYEGVAEDGDKFTGDIEITVGDDDEDDAEDITYTTDADDEVEFDEDEFEDVCDEVNNEDLNYVKFTPPASSKGVLYYKYDDGDFESKVGSGTAYFCTTSPAISDITFVPNDDFDGTVSIKYKGWDEDGDTFSGYVKITIKEGSNSSGDINYSIDADDELEFDEDDFNDYCEDENDEELDYVSFSIPSKSKGVLYYDYDGDDEKKIGSKDKFYYDKNPSIDDITFVPDDDYSGNCKISFDGEDQDGDSIDGTVVIAVDNEDLVADDIYLSGVAGTAVKLYDEYFNKECKDVLDGTLDYVKFTLPSSSYGTLYYNYTSANNYTSLVTSSTKYYYDDDSPDLSKVAFVSSGNSAGTYTIKYTGYDTDGSSFTGEVVLTLTAKTGAAGNSSSGAGSRYFSDVSGNYAWAVLYIDTLYSTSVIPNDILLESTKFNPGTNITRGDFMLMLCRALNITSTTAKTNFSDVAAGSYYYDAIAAAKALGIAEGSNNKFYPNSTITREDAMVLAQRAMNLSGNSVGIGNASDLYTYTDNASVSSYAKEAAAALIKAGIVTGSTDGKIHPKNTITRAESAAVIYRIKY